MTDDSSHSADEGASGTPDPAETDSPQTTDDPVADGTPTVVLTKGSAGAAKTDESGKTDEADKAGKADKATAGSAKPGDFRTRDGAAGASGPSPRTRMLVTAAAGVAALAALVCAVIFGMSGYKVYTDDKPTQSAREDAKVSAENAIINITTIDPSNVKDWQRRIDSSLTGDARSQITPDDFKKLTQQIEAAGTGQVAKLSSRVLRSATVEVNADDGTARVLVYVEATSKRPNEAGVKRSMGFMVGMTKKGDLWKASSITSLDSLALESDMTNAGNQATATQTPQPSTTEGAGN